MLQLRSIPSNQVLSSLCSVRRGPAVLSGSARTCELASSGRPAQQKPSTKIDHVSIRRPSFMCLQ